jgi:hypothetical protein
VRERCETGLDMWPSRAASVEDATAGMGYREIMRGIGSAAKGWRSLAKAFLMRDEMAWLRMLRGGGVPCGLPACPNSPNGEVLVRDMVAVAVLASRSV